MNEVVDPYSSLGELAAALGSGAVTSRGLAELYLERIADHDAALNAWADIFAEESLAAADGLDQLRRAGVVLGPLHGIPIGLKDLFEWEGHPCEGGSATLAGRMSPCTSTVTQRLLNAGMVILGKLNMVEFAFGGMDTNCRGRVPRNPWDGEVARIPGGSSSGSGVAVAAGLIPVAMGSDTGGSIRIPSALNGIVGLKPTPGRVSLANCMALSKTLDSNGPLTRTVADAALLLAALSGPDAADASTVEVPPWDDPAWRSRPVAGMRVAVVDVSDVPLEDAVQTAFEDSQRVLRELGATVVSVRPPVDWVRATAGNPLLIAAEGFAVHRAVMCDPASPISAATRARLEPGRSLTAADYLALLEDQQRTSRAYREFMSSYEALLAPGVPKAASALGADMEASLSTFTRIGNFCATCGLSLPAGWSPQGLPVGIQLLGRPFGESDLFTLGAAYERARPDLWARHPDLSWTHKEPQ